MKTIGVWEIEYPTLITGRYCNRTAFIRNTHVSCYVSLYGGGKIGTDSAVKCTNKQVIRHLEKLSLNLN